MTFPEILIGKYLFLFQTKGPIHLPPFKGGVFHGLFGKALMEISPYWQGYFLGNGHCHSPRPYVLLPPLDSSTCYEPGTEFSCELTLFGESALNWSVCHCALDYGASRLGLGKNRGKAIATAVQVACACPDTSKQIPAVSSKHIIGQRLSSLPDNSIHVKFITGMRLKNENRLVREPPSFSVFFSRLLGRLKSLVHFFGNGMDSWIPPEEEGLLTALSTDIQIASHSLYWDDWSRFSGRQQSWMKFGGLLGSIDYEGDLRPFLPYLALGEWTHMGGKTSFGLGKYILGGAEYGE